MANLLTVKAVAERLSVSTATVIRWIDSGKIKATKPGSEWRVDEQWLNRYIAGEPEPEPGATKSNEELQKWEKDLEDKEAELIVRELNIREQEATINEIRGILNSILEDHKGVKEVSNV